MLNKTRPCEKTARCVLHGPEIVFLECEMYFLTKISQAENVLGELGK